MKFLIQKLCFVVLLVLVGAGSVRAQSAGYSNVATTNIGGVLYVIPHATILVCTAAAVGTPCTPTVQAYADIGLTQPLSTPFFADLNGNYSFYVPTGIYQIQISSLNVATYTINNQVIGNTATNAAFSGLTTGTNTTATMMCGTGCSIVPTGSGIIDATECNGGPCGGSGTVIGATFTGGLISVTGTVTLAFTVVGTSGGIPYFSSGTGWASSAALPSGDFVLGGGVGSAPTATFSIVPIVNGGTGTGSPGLIAGTNITITGAWPNQTINSSGGGSGAWSGITSGINSNSGVFIATGNSWDFTGVTQFKGRVGAGLTTSANGDIGYDTIHSNWHGYNNGVDLIFPMISGTPVNGDCVNWVVNSGNYRLGDSGASCGGGSGGATLQTNTVNNSSQSVLNLLNSSAFFGLTSTVTNTSGGNVQLGFSGTLNLAGLTAPSSNGDIIAAVSGTWTEVTPGVPVVAETGTGPIVFTQAQNGSFFTQSNTSASSYTPPNAASLSNGYRFGIFNINTGHATITPATSTINGVASQILPENWAIYGYSDGTNYWGPVVPSFGVFPSCTSGGLGFNTSTGVFPCNTFANQALSNLSSVAVNLALTPGTDNSISLDSTSLRYINGWFSGVVGWTNGSGTGDTGVSRVSAGIVGIGNGSAGNTSGTIEAAAAALGGASPTAISGGTAGSVACGEGTAPTGVTSGYEGLYCSSADHNLHFLSNVGTDIGAAIGTSGAFTSGHIPKASSGYTLQDGYPVVGSDTHIPSSDGLTGATGALACEDSNGGLTTTGCPFQIANTTTSTGTSTLSANTCSSSITTVSMPGVTTAMTFNFTSTADTSAVSGWGANGGLVIDAWPTANNLYYKVCNQSNVSVTPGAVTWNVSAR